MAHVSNYIQMSTLCFSFCFCISYLTSYAGDIAAVGKQCQWCCETFGWHFYLIDILFLLHKSYVCRRMAWLLFWQYLNNGCKTFLSIHLTRYTLIHARAHSSYFRFFIFSVILVMLMGLVFLLLLLFLHFQSVLCNTTNFLRFSKTPSIFRPTQTQFSTFVLNQKKNDPHNNLFVCGFSFRLTHLSVWTFSIWFSFSF